ncbi:hypothetical protein MD26_25305 [Pseudomonas sp. H2]|nr:hypothetical protein PC358_02045 [Pseudomonas capeferrum]KGI90493.1 hypothetical protein MD26_25305 [Pseudomonas sp. H2]
MGVVKAPLQRACQPLEALIYAELVVARRPWLLGTEQDCGRAAARPAGALLLGQQKLARATWNGAWRGVAKILLKGI